MRELLPLVHARLCEAEQRLIQSHLKRGLRSSSVDGAAPGGVRPGEKGSLSQPCKLKMIHRPEHRWFWLISCYTLWDGRWSRLSQMAPCPQLGGGSMWRCVVCGSPAEVGGAVPGRLAGQLRVICSSCFLFFSSLFGPEKEG